MTPITSESRDLACGTAAISAAPFRVPGMGRPAYGSTIAAGSPHSRFLVVVLVGRPRSRQPHKSYSTRRTSEIRSAAQVETMYGTE